MLPKECFKKLGKKEEETSFFIVTLKGNPLPAFKSEPALRKL